MAGMPAEIIAVKKVPARAWVALSVLVLFYLLCTLDRGVLSLVVGPVKKSLQIDDFQMSLLLGLGYAVFYAFGGLPFGWAVDHYPRRLILYLGVTFWSIATIGCGLSPSFSYLLFFRMMLGACEAALGPSAHSIIADTFPKERMATTLSIYTFGAALGSGSSIAISGWAAGALMKHSVVTLPLVGSLWPWQALFVCIGLPGVVLAGLAFSFKEPPRLHKRGVGSVALLVPFLRRRKAVLLAFVCSFAVMSMATYGGFAWIPAHMDRHFGWGPAKIGPILGLVAVVSTSLGLVGGGIAVDVLIKRGFTDAHLRVFIAAIVVGAPVGIFAFLTNDPTIFLICLFVMELLVFSFTGYAAAAVQIVTPPELRGRMAGLFLLALALIGSGGGPSLIAFITQFVFHDPAKVGWSIAIALGILAPIAVLSAILGLKPMREAVASQRRADVMTS